MKEKLCNSGIRVAIHLWFELEFHSIVKDPYTDLIEKLDY